MKPTSWFVGVSIPVPANPFVPASTVQEFLTKVQHYRDKARARANVCRCTPGSLQVCAACAGQDQDAQL